jgi:ABC-type sugar transport system substrate-binding protein
VYTLQGRKAASNAGIPFVVVGRKLSPESFRQALIPYVEPNSKEAAALAAAAAAAAEAAAANKAAADAFFASAGKWGRGP